MSIPLKYRNPSTDNFDMTTLLFTVSTRPTVDQLGNTTYLTVARFKSAGAALEYRARVGGVVSILRGR